MWPLSDELHLAPAVRHVCVLSPQAFRPSCRTVRDRLLLMIVSGNTAVDVAW